MADNNNPYSNNFLKNLSQKKYAWMEEANTITAPVVPSPAPTTKPQSPKKSVKKQKVSSESTTTPTSTLSPSTEKKTSPSPPSSQVMVDAAVKDGQEEKVTSTEPRKPQPRFKYTNFPVKGYNILPTRNITSTYGRNVTTYFPGHPAGAPEIAPNPEEEWRDTIIIHPGSRNLRIGLASEAFPISVPHVIARRFNTIKTKNSDEMDMTSEDREEKYNTALAEIKGELKWRMKNAKRRAVPNAEGQVIGYNTSAFKETILDHNDPYKVEWTEATKNEPYFVGEKALNLPIPKESHYQLRSPWKYGTFNHDDYETITLLLADLETIWTESIVNELQVEKADFRNYNVAIVVADIFEKSHLVQLISMLLQSMNFRGVIVEQESTCATYGAGVSSAVVVDIGAQKTNITCIEDGVCHGESRISIDIGGDDITRTFTSFLLANKFPYADIDLNMAFDWKLAEGLKERWCTMNEADISVQVYDFFARTPFKPTLKYQCKVYDEVFLAPLCLVYPDILEPKKKKSTRDSWRFNYVTDDVVEDAATSVTSKSNGVHYESFPLDIAIAQSIVNASSGSEEKLKRYFTSIILVGGGGKVTNFSKVLEDRVLSTVLAQSAFIDRVEVLPAPRELDPEVLIWKGASVMSKLDIAKDMWIGLTEWNEIGSKCLRERALLM